MSNDPRSPQTDIGATPTGVYPVMSESDIAEAIAEHKKAEAERAREQALRAKVQEELEKFVARSQALKAMGVRGCVTVFFGKR